MSTPGNPPIEATRADSCPRVNGAAIRAIRLAKGLRQEEVVTRAGMSRGSLSRIETGRRGASRHSLTALAGALGVPVEVLTGQQPPIRALRTARGISPAALARDVGITPGLLTRLERGAELPDRQLIAVLARRLDVTAAVLEPHYAGES